MQRHFKILCKHFNLFFRLCFLCVCVLFFKEAQEQKEEADEGQAWKEEEEGGGEHGREGARLTPGYLNPQSWGVQAGFRAPSTLPKLGQEVGVKAQEGGRLELQTRT